MQTRWMTPAELARVEEICVRRDALYGEAYDFSRLNDICVDLRRFLAEKKMPRALREALGRCVRRRWLGSPTMREAVCKLLRAAEPRDDNPFRAAVKDLDISEEWLWEPPPPGFYRERRLAREAN